METQYSIKAEVEPLAGVLSVSKFIMPRHQRPYDWTTKNVTDLLEDLVDAIENDRPHHFLGNIMLVPHAEKTYAVSDGQQRITTFLLICASLCKIFSDSGDTAGEQQTLHMLFDIGPHHDKKIEDARKMKLKARVQPLTNDKTNFEALVSGNRVKKNGKLVAASNAINDFFQGDEFKSRTTEKKFLHFLLTKVLVATINFTDAMDSIKVFETQNMRGKSLEQIQLACTYFYLCIQKDEIRSDHLAEQIARIRTSLRSDEEAFFHYTRCLALCKYGHLSTEHFCGDIKRSMEKAAKERTANIVDEVCNFGKDLSEEYRIGVFQMLAQSNYHHAWFKELTQFAGKSPSPWTISDHVQDLRKYRGVSRAVLFSLFCKYREIAENTNKNQKKEMARFVCISGKLLSSFFQRAAHSTNASFVPSRYEEQVAQLAMKIANEECKTPDDFLDCLKEMDEDSIVPDNIYKAKMRDVSFPKKGNLTTAKHLLCRINGHLHGDSAFADIKSTLEHILPRSNTYAKNWGFNEEHGLYVHRLGNLALLSSKDNKSDEETNKSFKKKRALYRKSVYKVTQGVGEYDNWDKNSIETRQAWLAKLAAAVWNFKTNKP